MKVLTNTKEFEIAIMGVSPYDNVLRIEIIGSNMKDVFSVFSNEKETNKITHCWDGTNTVLEGYTRLQSVDALKNGDIIVALDKEQL